MSSLKLLAPLLLLALATGACRKAAPANVAAEVNGRPITFADLERRYKLQYPSEPAGSSVEQTSYQKLEMLRVMVDEEIMLQRAEKLSLIAPDADVELELKKLKAAYTTEDFQKQLDAQKITLEDLKATIRRDRSIEKLLNLQVTGQINVSEKDVDDFYNTNKASFYFAEPQIHLMQILVTPTPDSTIRNLKNDKAQNDEQARKKIEMLMTRLKQGDDFSMLAQSYSEDPNTAPNGGDMGFIPESALANANVDLRKLIFSLTPGQVSAPIKLQEGYRIIKLISREPAGQRDLNDPRVQQNIRDTLRSRRDQLLRAAYYEASRNEAKVINYYAISLAPGFDKK